MAPGAHATAPEPLLPLHLLPTGTDRALAGIAVALLIIAALTTLL
jgi:hypothetical protein